MNATVPFDPTQAGTSVRLRADPAQRGITTGRSRDDGDGLLIQVELVGRRRQFIHADELEPADAVLDEETALREGRCAGATSLRRILTAVQLEGRLNELIYCLDTTNTEFMPHQFKPLLALLDSPSKGLLIADEVGLGKTIEAGLIWTELRFRASATRLLVVCPAMLTQKWKDELAKRFGTRSQVLDAGGLLEWLESGHAQDHSGAIICSLQGIRPTRGWDDEKEPSQSPSARLARKLKEAEETQLFDLVVIDEAHYLRNEETSSAELGRMLRPVSDYLVLLTATPVNTRSTDLFNLVSLVDPEQFQFPHLFEQILDANRPLVQAANQLRRPGVSGEAIAALLDRAAEHWLLAESASLSLLRNDLAALDQVPALEAEERVDINQRLERVNLLGQVIVRTRKREVFTNRVERNARRVAAKMSPAEADFYRLVSEAIVNYAWRHAGVEGFLLAMPQRQMASSMYAAARRWLAQSGRVDMEEDESLSYEAFDAIDVGSAAPIVSYLSNMLAGRFDLAALREHDSKFDRLLHVLQLHEKEHPSQKVLLFSYFRGTLDYLHERLSEAGIPSLVVMGGDDKHALIKEFEENRRYRVLLSSEVAAEGVDLQFMRVVINYDLPWNPMKIEQRIGRVDRIGQIADAISIFNFVYADTIDDRILERLFERLKLFEESLGCTEEVLGDEITRLTRDLLSSRLTPEQELRRIDDTRAAIEQRQRDQALVESNEADLVGLGDYVRSRAEQAQRTQRRITDEDLVSHIRDYLDATASGYILRMDAAQPFQGILKLPAHTAARLAAFRTSHRLPTTRLENGHEERVVIRNHVSTGPVAGRFELINQYHPLIRMIAADPSVHETHKLLHAVRLAGPESAMDVAPGDYAFAVEKWTFAGAREEDSLRVVFTALNGAGSIDGDAAFDLLNGLRVIGGNWVDVGADLPMHAEALDKLDRARSKLASQFRSSRTVHEAENSDRVRLQRQSLERNAERRRESLLSRLRNAEAQGQKQSIKLTRGQLRKLGEQTEVALARVENGRVLRSERDTLVEGFLRVRG